MRSLLPVFLLLGNLAALAQAPDLSKLDIVERSLPDGPVALVDGGAVQKDRFLKVYHDQLTLLAAAAPDKAIADSDRVKTGLGVLAELIQWEILYSEGLKAGLSASEAEAGTAYQKQLQGLQAEAQRSGGAPPSEAEILQKVGKTRDEVMQEIRKALVIEKMRDKVVQGAGKGAVSDAEIKKFFTDNAGAFSRGSTLHLKQLYVRPQPSAAEASEAQWGAAQKKMEQALSRIHAGESFDAVARAVSEAPDKAKGGDMGVLSFDQIPPFYIDVAKNLQPGGISNIFKTKHGLHIIQLIAREEGDTVTLEEATPKIKSFLEHSKSESVVDEFCESVAVDPARVKIYLQLDRTLANMPELQGLGKKQ